MEPLIINPIYKEKIWGSKELLQDFYNVSEKEKIGESWNFALNDDDISTFRDFDMNIKNILSNENVSKKYLGNKIFKNKQIPFLIKTLFVNDRISLQVHPNNKFARKYENSLGKNEVWYVLYADDNSYAHIGFKWNIGKERVKKLLEENKIMNYLKKIKVKTGDIIRIPAGTVHDISGKVILYEIQQNSNITYRLKDWHGRELDIDKALKVLKYKNATVKNKRSGRLIKTKNFALDRINISGEKEIRSKGKMEVITVIEGEGTLISNKNIKLHKGMTILIPADLKRYTILGNISMLITH